MSLTNKIEKNDLARDALYEKVNTIAEELDSKKQDNLVSGTNIKTINGESIVGSGEILIDGMQNKITNCITEIPQDIKLELNDGVLTLKAGSKVYIPNGFEADGVTPKFDVVVIESDISREKFGSGSGLIAIVYVNNSLSISYLSNNYSGTTEPSSSNWLFYNTSTNLLYDQNKDVYKSFPLSVVSLNSGVVTSINQVFNGFGYIGSTVFALPGVKGLIPDGRNEDGSLKNIEFTIKTLKTFGYTGNVGQWLFGLNEFGGEISCIKGFYYEQNSQPVVVNNNQIWYQPLENKFYYSDWQNTTNFIPKKLSIVGEKTYDNNTNITSFNPKQPFRAVDWNDFPTITYWE